MSKDHGQVGFGHRSDHGRFSRIHLNVGWGRSHCARQSETSKAPDSLAKQKRPNNAIDRSLHPRHAGCEAPGPPGFRPGHCGRWGGMKDRMDHRVLVNSKCRNRMSLSIAIAMLILGACGEGCASRKHRLADREARLAEARAEYLAKESPRRRDQFQNVALAVDIVSREKQVPYADLIAALGEPDDRTPVQRDNHGEPATDCLTYNYVMDFPEGTWKLHVYLSTGIVTRIGYEELTGTP